MRVNQKSLTLEKYRCPKCGLTFPIWRKKGSTKGKDHKKYLWCPNCPDEERTNFKKVGGFI